MKKSMNAEVGQILLKYLSWLKSQGTNEQRKVLETWENRILEIQVSLQGDHKTRASKVRKLGNTAKARH